MSLIKVTNLTFSYEGSFDNIFDNVSFSIDTDWKLGFIGRNGKGKTTFLNILLGKYDYQGSIISDTCFGYFPYSISKEDEELTASELIEKWKSDTEEWRVICELSLLGLDADVLYRPLKTLSYGERTKVMLAVLFSGENDFLLIDEPTNHLDYDGREIIKKYLASKKGFILVSHDRDLLDACINHVLVLNRSTIEVQSGNFSSWWENKEKADSFAISENEKHKREIGKLKAAADRSARWAEKNENTKIGFDPVKEHDRNISTRAYIGAKTKKMQSRVKNTQERLQREISEKEGLLNDIETVTDLKLMPLVHHKDTLIECRDLSLRYKDSEKQVFEHLNLKLCNGDRLFLKGHNGCGKSSLIKAVLDKAGYNGEPKENNMIIEGDFTLASNLTISYINQDTSHLAGSLKDYAENNNVDFTLLLSLLRQLDFERNQFDKDMSDFSMGQKKKVLIASSLIKPAHIYIWDEPLNYIDVFSRMQLEKLIDTFKPTMILVEHDERFREKVGTRTVEFS